MKKLLTILLLAACSLSADTLILIGAGDLESGLSSVYVVPEGKVSTVESFAIQGVASFLKVNNTRIPQGTLKGTLTLPEGTRLTASAQSSEEASLVFVQLIERDIETTGYFPSNTAVIPNDANGQFNIILETSTDLIDWFPTLPGTYGGNHPSRFFRIRIVQN